jgi:hypothetical protein
MRIVQIGVALTLVLCLTVPAVAESIKELGDQAMVAYDFDPETDLTLAAQGIPDRPLPGGSVGIYDFEQKSVGKAFAYSLLIPGMGQFYTGSKVKGVIFMGVEVLGWVAWANYRSSGSNRTTEYEAFADAHWFDQPYWDSLQSHRGIDKWQDDQASFAHHLPWKINENGDTVADHNHEYYENVGKYDQFVWGWDDLQQFETPINSASPELSFQSGRRLEYVTMREDANKDYDKARVAGIVLIANHVVAALEAAFSAKSFNKRAQQASKFDVRIKVATIEDKPGPWVNVAYRF